MGIPQFLTPLQIETTEKKSLGEGTTIKRVGANSAGLIVVIVS